MKKIFAILVLPVLIVAACNTDIPRPAPLDPGTDWSKYCAQKTNCGLCASQSNCAFCPTTNQCVYYSPTNQAAKTSCPALVQSPELCK